MNSDFLPPPSRDRSEELLEELRFRTGDARPFEEAGRATEVEAFPPRAAEPLAARLGVDPESAARLARFDPFEATSKPERRWRESAGPYRRAAEVDDLLAGFVDDVVVGVPDTWIAHRAGLRPSQVRGWRRRHRLQAVPGRRPAMTHAEFIIRAAHHEVPPPSVHPTTGSESFYVPDYVLRQPIVFDELARCVAVLRDQGIGVTSISRAFGIVPRDVETAERLYRRRHG